MTVFDKQSVKNTGGKNIQKHTETNQPQTHWHNFQ